MNYIKLTGLLLLLISSVANSNSPKKNPESFFPFTKQFTTIPVLFDVVRVVTPVILQNTTNPPSWRAYLPSCPPGSTYVRGVSPYLLELDQAPTYSYCNCICKGNCNGVFGVTSPGGINPTYTARVTCKVNISGWFDSEVINQARMTMIPHHFYYCQSGNCSSNPLPAIFNFSVPLGGFANTIRIDFQACSTLANNICGAPDQTSVSRVAGTI